MQQPHLHLAVHGRAGVLERREPTDRFADLGPFRRWRRPCRIAAKLLARLRSFFDDPLLTIHGKRMLPTAFAEALLPQIQRCLRAADGVVTHPGGFDPATSKRMFRIIGSDYVTPAVLVGFLRQLRIEAPGLSFDLLLTDDTAQAALDRGEVDLCICPLQYKPEKHPATLLYEEEHVVAGWADNPIFRQAMSLEAFRAAKHIAVRLGAGRVKTFAERQLAELEPSLLVELTVSSFSAVPWLLVGTPLVAVMHKRLVDVMAEHFDIVAAPLPFAFPVMREVAQYHVSREGDVGLQWLVSRLASYVKADHPSVVPTGRGRC